MSDTALVLGEFQMRHAAMVAHHKAGHEAENLPLKLAEFRYALREAVQAQAIWEAHQALIIANLPNGEENAPTENLKAYHAQFGRTLRQSMRSSDYCFANSIAQWNQECGHTYEEAVPATLRALEDVYRHLGNGPDLLAEVCVDNPLIPNPVRSAVKIYADGRASLNDLQAFLAAGRAVVTNWLPDVMLLQNPSISH